MLDIEDYRKLSPEARKFYDEHRDYFDKMADRWDGMVDMPTIIESACERGIEPADDYEIMDFTAD